MISNKWIRWKYAWILCMISISFERNKTAKKTSKNNQYQTKEKSVYENRTEFNQN